MGQDASDSQGEQRSSSTNLTPAELDPQATLREDFSLAKISELGMVLFYERSLEKGEMAPWVAWRDKQIAESTSERQHVHWGLAVSLQTKVAKGEGAGREFWPHT